jgi:hypothetical protein
MNEIERVPRLTDKELLEIFPQAQQIVPALIKELGQTKNTLLGKIIEQNSSINAESSNEAYRYFWKSWYIQPLRDDLKSVDQKLLRLRRQLRLINGEPIPTGALSNDLIQEAKAVPIQSFIDQKYKQSERMLIGLCPFVEEKTPSFCIYLQNNRCWCFGCQQGYNAIDTFIKLYDCSFKEAVLTLTGGA